jgi:hypothetical protein
VGFNLECNTLLPLVLRIIGLLMIAKIIAALVLLYRGRRTSCVIAEVDVVHTANIGHGPKLCDVANRAFRAHMLWIAWQPTDPDGAFGTYPAVR